MHSLLKKSALPVRISAAATLACVTALAANAQTHTALTSTRVNGNQNDYPYVLGMDFNVNAGQSILITALGAFDSGQDGFVHDMQVGIYDRNTQTLIPGAFVTLSGTNQVLEGESRFQTLSSAINLTAGNYSIVAFGFGTDDPFGNARFGGPTPTIDDGGGLITFVNNARYQPPPNSGLVFPQVNDEGPANRYDAGTFQFADAMPEPGSIAMLGLGLLPLGAVIRRRARRTH